VNYNTIEFSEYKSYGILWLNQPQNLNALSPAMLDELLQFFSKEPSKDLRFLIVCGRGKCFGAGGDLKAMLSMSQEGAEKVSRMAHETFGLIRKYPIPVIAGIHGFAVGGGLELAMACDVAFATNDAWFSLPELQFSMLPGGGGTVRFTQRVGYQNAFWHLLSADKIIASQALQLGIIQKLFPPDNFETTIIETLQKVIIPIEKEAVFLMKQQIAEVSELVQQNFDNEAQRFSYLLNRYAKEKINMFFNKE